MKYKLDQELISINDSSEYLYIKDAIENYFGPSICDFCGHNLVPSSTMYNVVHGCFDPFVGELVTDCYFCEVCIDENFVPKNETTKVLYGK